MSGSKDIMDDDAELRAKARIVLGRAGVLEQCELHRTYFDTGLDLGPAYRLGNYLISKHQIEVEVSRRRDFSDAIRREWSNHVTLEGCPDCEHALVD